jgi:hypothetical protein
VKLIIEPTLEWINADGARCRVWKGRTESGVPVVAVVHGVAVGTDQPAEVHETFARELVETLKPPAFDEALARAADRSKP